MPQASKDAKGSAATASSLQARVNAAPFVPGNAAAAASSNAIAGNAGSQQQSPAKSSQDVTAGMKKLSLAAAAAAAPFVPAPLPATAQPDKQQAGKSSNTTAMTQAANASIAARMSASAASFVPKPEAVVATATAAAVVAAGAAAGAAADGAGVAAQQQGQKQQGRSGAAGGRSPGNKQGRGNGTQQNNAANAANAANAPSAGSSLPTAAATAAAGAAAAAAAAAAAPAAAPNSGKGAGANAANAATAGTAAAGAQAPQAQNSRVRGRNGRAAADGAAATATAAAGGRSNNAANKRSSGNAGGMYMHAAHGGGGYGGYGGPSGGFGGGGGLGYQQQQLPGGYHHQQQWHGGGHFGAGRGKAQLASQFMSEGLRQLLQNRNYLIQAQWVPGSEDAALPDKIYHYHSLFPLEDVSGGDEGAAHSAALGVRCSCLKAISAHDGKAYVLRQIDGKQVIPSGELLAAARGAVDAWAPLAACPALLVPRAAFVSAELDGSAALFFAHDYQPGAYTLAQAHLAPTQTLGGQLVRNTPSEQALWSYLVQLSGALRAVHNAGLALRASCLHPTKVLLTPLGRLRIGAIGVLDALGGDNGGEDVGQLQREDLMALGQLMLTLACSVSAHAAALPSLDFAAQHHSPDLVRAIAMLLAAGDNMGGGGGGGSGFSWRHLWALIGEHAAAEIDVLGSFNDSLITDLGQEMENGRLLRLLVKLAQVMDRPEAPGMPSWSETGDRYLLKLFQDHVFHQVSKDGSPRLDWGHVVESLNKLDAGVAEQLLLLSRDEASMLVVSYADIKRCVETAFAELKSQQTLPMGPGGNNGNGRR